MRNAPTADVLPQVIATRFLQRPGTLTSTGGVPARTTSPALLH